MILKFEFAELETVKMIETGVGIKRIVVHK